MHIKRLMEADMENLINEAKKGNKEAFTQLIISMEQDLYKIARKIILNI